VSTGGTAGSGGSTGDAGHAGGGGDSGQEGGQCDAASCPDGCCDSGGHCQTSDTGTCGTGGAACVACAAGQACSGGKCACDAASCPAGCCNGGACLAYAGQSNALCGTAGAACAGCPGGEVCSTSNGSCAASTTGPCTWAAGPSSGDGELTCYWFGQGTAQGNGCSSYKTYCGYCGTESGNDNGGSCPTGITDSVPNTGTPYFAAFPVGTFGQGKYCGMCVEVTWQSKSITATIVDECGTCSNAGHIDLSLSAAVALGLGQGGATADPTSGVTWKAVDCPVTGDIVGVYNNGYAGQIYFQNVEFPVASATAGGHTATQAYGYWDFGTSVAGKPVTLTDTVGHVITGTIPGSSGGSIGAQFPATCQ
jgi:hypothetical protein